MESICWRLPKFPGRCRKITSRPWVMGSDVWHKKSPKLADNKLFAVLDNFWKKKIIFCQNFKISFGPRLAHFHKDAQNDKKVILQQFYFFANYSTARSTLWIPQPKSDFLASPRCININYHHVWGIWGRSYLMW